MIDPRFRDLLSHLWRDGSYGYYWTPDTDEGKLSFWFPARTPKDANMLRNVNAYFGVHPSNKSKGMRERTKLEDVEVVNCLFAEFDLTEGQSPEHLLQAILDLEIPPSVINFSGGGYHGYWLLEHPYHIDSDEARQRIINIQYAWVDYVGSDGGAKDLSRVLRIPGTLNRKEEYAPNFPEIKIVKFDLDDTHSLDDFTTLVEHVIREAERRRASVANTDVVPVDLDDQTILEKMLASNPKAARLFDGDMSDYGDDHSKADLALCNILAFWFGRDKERMDRVFRRSELYRPKWLRDDYRNQVLDKAIASCADTYTPQASIAEFGDPEELVALKPMRTATVAVPVAPTTTAPNGASHTTGSVKNPHKRSASSNAQSQDYIRKLTAMGYQFRLNELDDTIEVNGERIDDVTAAQIRTKMRDLGYTNMPPIEDAYLTHAGENRYHPVREFLDSLKWDGGDYIGLLAMLIKDDHDLITYANGDQKPVFYAWLKRWMVGSVAKVFGGAQNPMLVIDAKQGIGKSSFVQWLGSPMPEFFIESAIKTDDKEHDRHLATKWIWEVAELGATTRRQDVEALKSFLTKHDVTFRVPWGRHAIVKPALASFIGTINNETGFLTDITGNRRFITVHVTSFDWMYKVIDVRQLWAQAVALWRAGEPVLLLPEEAAMRDRINAEYQIEDPYEGWILKYYHVDANELLWKTKTQDIADLLQAKGVRGETKAIQMQIGKTLKAMGLRQHSNDRPRVWMGIKPKSDPFDTV